MNHIIKNNIKACFNKAWKTYDENCSVQQEIGEHAIKLLKKYQNKFNAVADFACGTGVSTQMLVKHVNSKKIYAIDFSENLLAIAKSKFYPKNTEFKLSDFDTILFSENYLDLIFCNMGLQWAVDLQHTLKLFNFYLSKSGMLVFSIPIDGTFSELKSCYRNFSYRSHDIESLLEQCHFEIIGVSHQVYIKRFSTPLDAIRSIKSVGATCTYKDHRKTGLKSKTYVDNMFIRSNNITLTYRLAIFVVKN